MCLCGVQVSRKPRPPTRLGWRGGFRGLWKAFVRKARENFFPLRELDNHEKLLTFLSPLSCTSLCRHLLRFATPCAIVGPIPKLTFYGSLWEKPGAHSHDTNTNANSIRLLALYALLRASADLSGDN